MLTQHPDHLCIDANFTCSCVCVVIICFRCLTYALCVNHSCFCNAFPRVASVPYEMCLCVYALNGLFCVPLSAELYENLGQVGASIKHHLVEGMRNMWQQLNEFARSHSSSYVAEKEQQDTTGVYLCYINFYPFQLTSPSSPSLSSSLPLPRTWSSSDSRPCCFQGGGCPYWSP